MAVLIKIFPLTTLQLEKNDINWTLVIKSPYSNTHLTISRCVSVLTSYIQNVHLKQNYPGNKIAPIQILNMF